MAPGKRRLAKPIGVLASVWCNARGPALRRAGPRRVAGEPCFSMAWLDLPSTGRPGRVRNDKASVSQSFPPLRQTLSVGVRSNDGQASIEVNRASGRRSSAPGRSAVVRGPLGRSGRVTADRRRPCARARHRCRTRTVVTHAGVANEPEGVLRRWAARGPDVDSRALFAPRASGRDGVRDEIRRGRRGRSVRLDHRRMPEVAGIAVGGAVRVGAVPVRDDARRSERRHEKQCCRERRRPFQRRHEPH